MVRFAHLADLHLGGWRDEKLKALGLEAFTKAIDMIVEEAPDFVVIAGDLFNTALPSIEAVKHASVQLSRLRMAAIPVYFIAGSHDYSVSGKSMLDVLEGAGLARNVQKAHYSDGGRIVLEYTLDEKSGVKLAGLPGKKGALESQYYEVLDREAAAEESGTKVFLFHMLLSEFKRATDDLIPSSPTAVLPPGFSYYAGGHPHLVDHKRFGDGIVAYPGPLFPNNFEELEELGSGGFYFVDLERGSLDWRRILTRPLVRIDVSFDGEPAALQERILEELDRELAGSIVLVRASGELTGSVSQVDWPLIEKTALGKGAYAFAKNTYKLASRTYERVDVALSADRVESDIITEFSEKTSVPEALGERAFERLFSVLATSKHEGETNADYEKRVRDEFEAEFDVR
jgi:DNA repair protein SbcD/Mre11